MLGKLIKYEMKAALRLLPIVYLAIAAIYIIGLLAKALDIAQIRVVMSAFLVIGGAAAVIMTFVNVIIRFAKGLFGAEGYLTQTLPVGKGSLIFSKVLTAYIWMVLSITVACLAILAMMQLNNISELNKLIDVVFGGNFTPLVIYGFVTGALQLLVYLGAIYFSITLANTRIFMKNNIAFSIVFFFALSFIVNLLEMVAMLIIPLGINISDSGVIWTTETMLGSLQTNWSMMSSEPLVNNISIGVGNGLADLLAGIVLLMLARWFLMHKTSVK